MTEYQITFFHPINGNYSKIKVSDSTEYRAKEKAIKEVSSRYDWSFSYPSDIINNTPIIYEVKVLY